MREFKHLKSFESFSQTDINEEISFKDIKDKAKSAIAAAKEGVKKILTEPISKAISQFESENSDLMKELKEAEKEKGERLKKIQTQLIRKLQAHKPELKKVLKDDSDVNTAVRELTDKIKNTDPEDTRTTIQKLASGASGGFPGGKSKK